MRVIREHGGKMNNLDGQTIEILNWEKYNPKRAQTTYTWLRLNNSIATEPKLFGLDPEQKYAWIVMLCEVSKENKSTYQLNLPFLEHLTGVSQKKLNSLLSFLVQKKIIKALHQTTPECSDSNNSLPLRDETNETNETDEHADSSVGERVNIYFDFEGIYQEYPRKDGKQEGLKICKAKIKTQEDYNKLLSAVRRYRAQCELEGIDKQYIKHFSTFMNSNRWKDWLEPDAGSSTVIASDGINWDRLKEKVGA